MQDATENGLESQRLHFAAMQGDIETLDAYLGAGDPIDRFDELGKTALHYAAENNHLDAVEFLLRRGATVNAIDPNVCGDTTLGAVAGNCSLEMAKLLVSAGADPIIPGNMRLTAIDRAKLRKRGDGPAVYEFLCRVRSRMR